MNKFSFTAKYSYGDTVYVYDSELRRIYEGIVSKVISEHNRYCTNIFYSIEYKYFNKYATFTESKVFNTEDEAVEFAIALFKDSII